MFYIKTTLRVHLTAVRVSHHSHKLVRTERKGNVCILKNVANLEVMSKYSQNLKLGLP